MLKKVDSKFIVSCEYIINPFHLVEYRPWPFIGSVGALFITRGLVGWFHGWRVLFSFFGLFIVLFTM